MTSATPMVNLSTFLETGRPATEAFARAFVAARDSGAAGVFVPRGTFVTGTVVIPSTMTLYLAAGAELVASENPDDFPQGALIYAADADRICVAGQGTIRGNHQAFLRYSPRAAMWVTPPVPEDLEDFEGDKWLPEYFTPRPKMVHFEDCTNVCVDGVTLSKSAFWTLHLSRCHDVKVSRVTISNGIEDDHVANADGIDVDACTNVRISDCNIRTSDDAIVLKIGAGRPDSRCEAVTIANCTLVSDECAIKIGTESHGVFKNIVATGCTVAKAGAAFAAYQRDGGLIENVLFSDMVVDLDPGSGGVPIFVWSGRRTQDTPVGRVRGLVFRGIHGSAMGGGMVCGFPDRHLESVTVENVDLEIHGRRDKRLHGRPRRFVEQPHLLADNPPHPYPTWCHKLAPIPFYARYISHLRLRDVRLALAKERDAEAVARDLSVTGGTFRIQDCDRVERS